MTDAKSKHDRRAQLLMAARAILAEKGFEATTVSEIVARAGVAQGTFYLYFPSKVALVVALDQEMNEYTAASVREATAHAQTAAELVALGVSAAFQQIENYRDILAILHSRSVLDRVPIRREQHLETYHHLIAELIRQRQAIGEINSAINARVTARLITGLIDHAAEECFLYDLATPSTIYVTEVIHFVQRALGIGS